MFVKVLNTSLIRIYYLADFEEKNYSLTSGNDAVFEEIGRELEKQVQT